MNEKYIVLDKRVALKIRLWYIEGSIKNIILFLFSTILIILKKKKMNLLYDQYDLLSRYKIESKS